MKTLITLMSILLLMSCASVQAADYQINQLRVKLPSGDYEATTYLPTKENIKAILILTPTIAGVSILEKILANYFSKEGFLVIMPLPFDGEVESLQPSMSQLDADFLRPALAVDSFIDLVEEKFKLAKKLPVFALGSSQGGIRTLILASHSPRITAAWFATTGGDFASIYAYSTVEKISAFRKKHMDFLGMDIIKDYEIYLRNNLQNDPLIACHNIKVPFVQIIALKDDKVPTKNQELLAKNCPEHKVIRINTGHSGGSLSTISMRKKIKTFFFNSL